MSGGRSPGRAAIHLEKLYIDVLSPDGGVLILYLAWLRGLGLRLGRVAAEMFAADGSVRCGSASVDPRSIEIGPGSLRFGPARFERETIAWRTEGLAGWLTISNPRASVSPGAPFLEEGSQRLYWTVEVPDCVVNGDVTWPGGGIELVGRGYRDRVQSHSRPWCFPLRELRWGHAAAGEHAVVWATATTPRQTVEFCWRDGRVSPELMQLRLSEQRMLMEGAVLERRSWGLGLLRPMLRCLARDPHQTKWAAGTVLDGEVGRAIHERVAWR